MNFVEPPTTAARSRVTDAYPEMAQRMALPGAALVSCVAGADGALGDCAAVVETPKGQGFGDAALRLAHGSRLAPTTSDGRSIEGARVYVPIHFERGRGRPAPTFRWESPPEASGPPSDINVAAAISNICLPYVLEGVDSTMLPTNHLPGRDDGWRGLMFPQPGATVLRIGAAGFVHVAVYKAGDTRHCDLSVARADPARMRAVILRALAARPEGFSPTKSRYSPAPFATEDLLCAQPGSAHPGGFARLSAASKSDTPMSILFTLTDSPIRMEACDHEGVALMGRALVAP